MASLSITRAWNETTEFLRREAGLVLPIAFLLISLPGAIMQYAMPVAEPGVPFDMEGFTRGIRMVLLMLPVVVLLSLIGTIAITHLAIRAGASVGEALQVGARRFIFLFAASLMVGLAMLVALLPMILLIWLSAPAPVNPGLLLLMMLVYLILFLAGWMRLLLITPVATAEAAGPVEILRRSWQLTEGHFWKLLGFVILFWIAALVLLFVISIFLGLIVALAAGGAPVPGSGAAFVALLLTAVLQAVMTSVFATMISRIYVQLARPAAGDVFA